MDTSPIGLGKNWVTAGGGLPLYIRAVAHAFLRNGVPESRAIQRAVGVVQDWSRGSDGKGGHVTAATQAKAAAAIRDWERLKARAHAHANDADGIELAGAFNGALHPRVAKGHGNAGQFGSNGTALKTAPSSGFKAAGAAPASTMKPGPIKAPGPAPEPPADAARIRQLRLQAKKDRQLARQINAKANALVRVRAGYIAGLLTSTGKAKTTVAKKTAKAAKKAVRKKAAKSSTKGKTTAAATKAANIAKLNGQISTLRGDAKALAKSANHLDALANSL
jgi:hypothetical protein